VDFKTYLRVGFTDLYQGIIMTIAIPYLVNPDQANARGKIGFFFGGLAAISLVWSYFRVPETKGEF
jgi:MFS transporter, SP family, general alpha glucoside:H+ symporter